MTHQTLIDKPSGIAGLRNVTLALQLAQTLLDRPAGLPGIGVFHGPSGFGKSFGCARVHAHMPSIYLELARAWSVSAFLKTLCHALEIDPVPHATAARFDLLVNRIERRQAAQGPLLLMLDEADYAVENNLVDTIRDIHERSRLAVMLIGEERLPQKLQRWERMHNRVLSWIAAEPCDLDDARALAQTYCRGMTIADAVLTSLLKATHGVTRRIAINLSSLRQIALAAGIKSVDVGTLTEHGIRWQSGEAPAARSATR